MYRAGIDIGSRTTKIILLKDKKIISKHIQPTGWNPVKSGIECFNKALQEIRISEKEIEKITATGYGRVLLPIADQTVTEITCHAKGAHFLSPDIRTIIDIGGQDSKIIRVDNFGLVEDFAMNDRCAAGTGKFLEFLAHSLNINISDFGKLATKSDNPASISSMCTVFAESEVLSLVAESVSEEDIVAGIHLSIARRIEALINTVGFNEVIAFTGGVAKNEGLRHQLEQLLKIQIHVPENPEYMGALGAALSN